MKMDLKELCQKVEFRYRMKTFEEFELIRKSFKKYFCPEVEVKNCYQFETIEQFILNNDKIENKTDCLLMSKDLLAYLKTEENNFGIYTITKNNIPLLSIIIDSRFRWKQIEINDYASALKTETTIGSKLINFIFNL